MELEPDKDCWRRAEFLVLHHHLRLLTRAAEIDEYAQFTTSLRGKVVGFKTANLQILTFQYGRHTFVRSYS